MQPRPDTWEAKALAAFWADEFKEHTLDSHARIRAAVSAAALFLIHTYTDTHPGHGASTIQAEFQQQRDGLLHGQHRQDSPDDTGGGDPSGQAGPPHDGAA